MSEAENGLSSSRIRSSPTLRPYDYLFFNAPANGLLKTVCHCFAEAVRVVLPYENTASAKQWHTVSGNRYFFNGLQNAVFSEGAE